MKPKTCGLMFSGHNPRAIIAFCRFAVERKIQFYIIANGDDDPIFKTSYRNKVIFTRPKNKLVIEDVLNYSAHIKNISKTEAILILPTTEFLNRFLLNNKDALAHHNISSGMCDKSVYEEISDKFTFGQLCRTNGINVPREFDDFPKTYPFVIKPKEYKVGNNILEKPIIVNSESDIINSDKNLDLENIYIQEYIGGRSLYLLCYFYRNGDFAIYSQENFVQQNNGRSMILAKSSDFHHHEVTEQFVSTLKSHKFYGLVMIEVKVFNDKAYMIEANPRFWGPSQLINDANMSLFDCFALDNNLIESIEDREYLQDVWYYWSGGKIEDENKGRSLSYYNFDENDFSLDEAQFKNNDIYFKDDTINIYFDEHNIMKNNEEQLIELYERNSKHSNYQVIPTALQGLITDEQVNILSRYEFERLDFLKQHLDFDGKHLLDIGGNTGFFTFESITSGADSVDYVEGNANHSQFVAHAAKMLDFNITAYNKYFDFESAMPKSKYDIVLLFNVIHHIGDDYGDQNISVENARKTIAESINFFAGKTEYLVLQFGFCWKGNRDLLLFENGTKKEMIDFVNNAIDGKWTVSAVGVAEEENDSTVYHPLSDTNIERKDNMGEFRNRPIFILKSL